MADKNTTSNINLAAAEELPKAQSKFKEFVKKFMKRKTAVISLAFIVFIIFLLRYMPQNMHLSLL